MRRGTIVCRLSDDLLLHVFSFLEPRLLSLMVSLNQRMKRLASEDILWRAVLATELGESNLPTGGAPGAWRRRFWQWHRLDSCVCEERQQTTLAEAPPVRAALLLRPRSARPPRGATPCLCGGTGKRFVCTHEKLS